MDFSWARAFEVALVGFVGVFVILLILAIVVGITGKIIPLIEGKISKEKKAEK